MTPSGQSNTLPRGRCPACSGDVALRRGGELREHRASRRQLELAEPGELRYGKCPGSGLTIAQVEREIDGEIEALRRASQQGIA